PCTRPKESHARREGQYLQYDRASRAQYPAASVVTRRRSRASPGGSRRRPGARVSFNVSNLLYLVTIVTFILALRYLSNTAHARRGNQIGAVGMLLAIVVTWVKTGGTSWWALALGMVIGGGFGAVGARRVKMTAMPQMVALVNGVGGGAATLIALAELHRLLPQP